jgi:hypothetical protein
LTQTGRLEKRTLRSAILNVRFGLILLQKSVAGFFVQ